MRLFKNIKKSYQPHTFEAFEESNDEFIIRLFIKQSYRTTSENMESCQM